MSVIQQLSFREFIWCEFGPIETVLERVSRVRCDNTQDTIEKATQRNKFSVQKCRKHQFSKHLNRMRVRWVNWQRSPGTRRSFPSVCIIRAISETSMTWNCEWWNSQCPLLPFVRDLAQQIQPFPHCTHIASGKLSDTNFRSDKWCNSFTWEMVSRTKVTRLHKISVRLHQDPDTVANPKLNLTQHISFISFIFNVAVINLSIVSYILSVCDKFRRWQIRVHTMLDPSQGQHRLTQSLPRARAHNRFDVNVWRACTV